VKTYERTKLYDLAAAVPLIVFYGLSAWENWPRLIDGLRKIGRDGWLSAAATDVLVLALTFVFLGTLVVLLLLRTVPSAKAGNFFPRLAAVCGTFASIEFQYIPAAHLPRLMSALSLILIAGGTLATIIAFFWLGRSFSIMPEARRLVTKGPYRLVRHPVYLFEELTLFGIMLQHAQPMSFLLLAVQVGFQLARIHYEEAVLTASFPEYRAYAARTFRLIPGVY
jgi:protein-S-isoprenylcysteine O-methyltransferase Ste14